MRVIGTGWRYWATSELNLDRMYEFMDNLLDLIMLTDNPVLQLVLGGGGEEDSYPQGADRALMEWAKANQESAARYAVPDPIVFPANWEAFDKAAGPLRNAQMITAGADLVVGFVHPQSKGTRDCLSKAKRAGIPILALLWADDPEPVDIPEQKVASIDELKSSATMRLEAA